MALACDPDLVVLDEPTTGLDVTTQEQIVSLLVNLRARLHMSMLYVTHDLGLLSQIADRMGVMYAGRMVEVASTPEIFENPIHPYTRGLIGSMPRMGDWSAPSARPLQGLLQRQSLPKGCPFSPRCDYAVPGCFEERQELCHVGSGRLVACWRHREITVPDMVRQEVPAPDRKRARTLLSIHDVSVSYGTGQRRFTALRGVSLTVREGETLALVGESGSGKSTLARAISGQIAPSAGTIALAGETLAGEVADRTPEQRRLIQYVFQNPDASLNPRARIGRMLARVFCFFFGSKAGDVGGRVDTALADVRLDADYGRRFPDELSGGERQRVAIARALLAEPALLLCDEILSALDVSVQANILALLRRLRSEHGITMLFISHDLAVVRTLADRVCVLFRGEVMEIGTREEVFAPPYHPYTLSLLQAIPTPMRRRSPVTPAVKPTVRGGEAAGCAYAGRCPRQVGVVCERERPPWRETTQGSRIRCHLTLEELEQCAN
jgi:peptide/nickel transport system ATP-binding protein